MGDTALPLALPTYTIRSPQCNWPIKYTTAIATPDQLPSWGLNGAQTGLEFFTENEALVLIQYKVDVYIDFEDANGYNGSPPDPVNDYLGNHHFAVPKLIRFYIDITDPCVDLSTSFNALGTCDSITASVLDGGHTATVDLNAWTDVVSGQRGSLKDGYTLCGGANGENKSFTLTPTAVT